MCVWNISAVRAKPRLSGLNEQIVNRMHTWHFSDLSINIHEHEKPLLKGSLHTEISLLSIIRWRHYGHALPLTKMLCSICLLYSGRHYIPIHQSRVSQWVIYLVNLCYVGGMKWSVAENNGWERVKKIVYM